MTVLTGLCSAAFIIACRTHTFRFMKESPMKFSYAVKASLPLVAALMLSSTAHAFNFGSLFGSKDPEANKAAVTAADRKRFAFVNGIVKEVESRKVLTKDKNFQDKIDAVLTNKWLGIPGERNMKIWIKLSACLCVFAPSVGNHTRQMVNGHLSRRSQWR